MLFERGVFWLSGRRRLKRSPFGYLFGGDTNIDKYTTSFGTDLFIDVPCSASRTNLKLRTSALQCSDSILSIFPVEHFRAVTRGQYYPIFSAPLPAQLLLTVKCRLYVNLSRILRAWFYDRRGQRCAHQVAGRKIYHVCDCSVLCFLPTSPNWRLQNSEWRASPGEMTLHRPHFRPGFPVVCQGDDLKGCWKIVAW